MHSNREGVLLTNSDENPRHKTGLNAILIGSEGAKQIVQFLTFLLTKGSRNDLVGWKQPI